MPAVIPDLHIWAAALAIVRRYGDDSMFKAAQRADQLDEGGMAGAETWRRILNAIERLQAKARGGGREGALDGQASGAGF